MTGWSYLIPAFAGTRWERVADSRRSHYSADLEWPRIGVYCPHDPDPWLLGSFTVSGEVLEQLGDVSWSWRREYMAGNGDLLHLGDGHLGQALVGNQPYDRDAAGAALSKAVEEHGVLSPQAQAASSVLDRANEDLRIKVSLKCGICGRPRNFRSDRLSPILTTFWKHGIREVTFAQLTARVHRAAR